MQKVITPLLSRKLKDKIKAWVEKCKDKNHPIPLSKEQIQYFTSQARLSPEKAEKMLNFTPQFSYDQGFAQVAYWHKHFYAKILS